MYIQNPFANIILFQIVLCKVIPKNDDLLITYIKTFQSWIAEREIKIIFNFCYSYSFPRVMVHHTIIWNKVIRTSSKIGQDYKTLVSAFACFLTAIVNFLFWKGYCLHPNLRFLQYFLSLQFFWKCWGNSCTKFVIFGIKFRLICGKLY